MKKIKWGKLTTVLGNNINHHHECYPMKPKHTLLFSCPTAFYLYRLNSLNKYPTNFMIKINNDSKTKFFADHSFSYYLINTPYCLFVSDIL